MDLVQARLSTQATEQAHHPSLAPGPAPHVPDQAHHPNPVHARLGLPPQPQLYTCLPHPIYEALSSSLQGLGIWQWWSGGSVN